MRNVAYHNIDQDQCCEYTKNQAVANPHKSFGNQYLQKPFVLQKVVIKLYLEISSYYYFNDFFPLGNHSNILFYNESLRKIQSFPSPRIRCGVYIDTATSAV